MFKVLDLSKPPIATKLLAASALIISDFYIASRDQMADTTELSVPVTVSDSRPLHRFLAKLLQNSDISLTF